MKKMIALLSVALLCVSCTASIRVNVTGGGKVSVKYDSNVVGDLLSVIFGEEEFKGAFNKEEIEKALLLSNFTDVKVTRADTEAINFSFSLKEGDEDVILRSRILEVSSSGSAMEIDRGKLLRLYELMPNEARYYVDLFMAPVFTAQEMSGEEYVSLMEAVYGKNVAQKLTEAFVRFELCAKGKCEKKSIALLELLNLKEEISLRIK